MARIFISYKRVDKDKVFKIKDKIESAIGEQCWIDLDGIESDAQFKNVIINAINNAEIVLFMYSKSHIKIVDFENDWTVRELNFAKAKKKRIVFINIDGSPLTDEFAFDYGTKQQVDARLDKNVDKLISDIRKWLNINHIDTANKNNHHPELSSLALPERKKWILGFCVGMIAVSIAIYFYAKDYNVFRKPSVVESSQFTNEALSEIDLGLPSGTLWANKNEGANTISDGGFLSYPPMRISQEEDDVWHVPSEKDFDELIGCCKWIWTEVNGKSGYRVEGKNGNWGTSRKVSA